jgi:DNA-binding IclR family transcriptional regulator
VVAKIEAQSGTQSVIKALQVLELYSTDTTLRVIDVAQQLGVANSTAHRLLNTLREQGYVRQEGNSSRYGPGQALFRLARRFDRDRALTEAALPHLVSLRSAVNETVNFQVLAGRDTLFAASLEDTHRLRVAQRSGTRALAYLSAGGRVLLSCLDEAQIRALYSEPLSVPHSHATYTIDDLLADLLLVRRQGYALNSGDLDRDVAAISAAVSDRDGLPVAAISIAAPATRMPRGRALEYLPLLRAATSATAKSYFGSVTPN